MIWYIYIMFKTNCHGDAFNSFCRPVKTPFKYPIIWCVSLTSFYWVASFRQLDPKSQTLTHISVNLWKSVFSINTAISMICWYVAGSRARLGARVAVREAGQAASSRREMMTSTPRLHTPASDQLEQHSHSQKMSHTAIHILGLQTLLKLLWLLSCDLGLLDYV